MPGADLKLDCVGLFCPMPVLKTREAMRRLEPGQILEMTSDDPASEADVRSWTTRTGNELMEIDRNGATFRFLIRKAR
ncbi:MAG: sulfurtransferase TusA family protein [Candidatus Rokuibacteriota bacterium]|nr:MAG: sulfurtransferase TusA family protein [Candidatus Rokubacteria bacterium]